MIRAILTRLRETPRENWALAVAMGAVTYGTMYLSQRADIFVRGAEAAQARNQRLAQSYDEAVTVYRQVTNALDRLGRGKPLTEVPDPEHIERVREALVRGEDLDSLAGEVVDEPAAAP